MQNYAFNYRIHREPCRAIFQIAQNLTLFFKSQQKKEAKFHDLRNRGTHRNTTLL